MWHLHPSQPSQPSLAPQHPLSLKQLHSSHTRAWELAWELGYQWPLPVLLPDPLSADKTAYPFLACLATTEVGKAVLGRLPNSAIHAIDTPYSPECCLAEASTEIMTNVDDSA